MSFYCKKAPGHPVHHFYHATEYGFPLEEEQALFERMALEIFQAGLSWEIVLKKRKATVKAFHGFKVDRVAKYKAKDVKRLLADPGIIRNRLKIKAMIENARRLQKLREEFGGFDKFIAAHHPLTKKEWVKLFKQRFKFMGGEIVGEFLMSIGYLPGAHHEKCPVHRQLKTRYAVPWMKAKKKGFKYA
jgi:DNA-3-methyladenine glycosylase I